MRANVLRSGEENGDDGGNRAPAILVDLPGDAYHFVAGDYFYALAIMFVVLAELYFVLLKRFPAFPSGVFEPAFGQIGVDVGRIGVGRSEEHTSELQSRFELVCRLLLEKTSEL